MATCHIGHVRMRYIMNICTKCQQTVAVVIITILVSSCVDCEHTMKTLDIDTIKNLGKNTIGNLVSWKQLLGEVTVSTKNTWIINCLQSISLYERESGVDPINYGLQEASSTNLHVNDHVKEIATAQHDFVSVSVDVWRVIRLKILVRHNSLFKQQSCMSKHINKTAFVLCLEKLFSWFVTVWQIFTRHLLLISTILWIQQLTLEVNTSSNTWCFSLLH
jgi:hypothetical protein